MTPEQKLVHTLLVMFGEPNTPDPKLYIDMFTKAITGYPDDVLQAAGEAIIRKNTFWPKPAEVLAEVNRIGGYGSRRGLQTFEPCEEPPPLTDEQKARVREIKRLAIEACDKVHEVLPPLAPPPKVDRETFEAMRSSSPNPIHRKSIVRR